MAAIAERPLVGQECHLYYNTGDRTTPVLVEITRAINVNASIPFGEAEIASRLSQWKTKRQTTRELEITFTYQKKGGTDAVLVVLLAASTAGTVMDIWMLDGALAETGSQGPRMYCQVFDETLGQDLEAVEEIEFVAKATYYETGGSPVDPDWYVVPTP